MKKTASMQKVLAMPLVFIFVALLLVFSLGSTNDTYAANGARPLIIVCDEPGVTFLVTYAGVTQEYYPGIQIPILGAFTPVTITAVDAVVEGWSLAWGSGGQEATIVAAGNSATLNVYPWGDNGIVTVCVDASGGGWDGGDWDGSGASGSGNSGSGDAGSGLPGSGSSGSGNSGSGTSGSGLPGSGSSGSGGSGSGNHGSGNSGSGNAGSGLPGSGSSGSGSSGSGLPGSGSSGSGSRGRAAWLQIGRAHV